MVDECLDSLFVHGRIQGSDRGSVPLDFSKIWGYALGKLFFPTKAKVFLTLRKNSSSVPWSVVSIFFSIGKLLLISYFQSESE